MSTSTHVIEIKGDGYTNVSNGNINCTLVVVSGQTVRIHVGGTLPHRDTDEYVLVSGPGGSSPRSGIVTVTDLVDEAELWVRAEDIEDTVVVIRGPSSVVIGSGG